MRHIGKRFVGLLLLAMFMLLFYKLTLPHYKNASSSKNWSIVKGQVLKSKVNPYAGDDRNMYRLEFDYQYIVNNTVYHGKGRHFQLGEPSQSWKGGLYDFARSHPVGSSIDVYYNPDSPKDCTIITGVSTLDWVLIGMNVFFLFFSVHLVLFPEDWRAYS